MIIALFTENVPALQAEPELSYASVIVDETLISSQQLRLHPLIHMHTKDLKTLWSYFVQWFYLGGGFSVTIGPFLLLIFEIKLR